MARIVILCLYIAISLLSACDKKDEQIDDCATLECYNHDAWCYDSEGRRTYLFGSCNYPKGSCVEAWISKVLGGGSSYSCAIIIQPGETASCYRLSCYENNIWCYDENGERSYIQDSCGTCEERADGSFWCYPTESNNEEENTNNENVIELDLNESGKLDFDENGNIEGSSDPTAWNQSSNEVKYCYCVKKCKNTKLDCCGQCKPAYPEQLECGINFDKATCTDENPLHCANNWNYQCGCTEFAGCSTSP